MNWEKKNFPFGKMEFCTYWEFCAYHRIFWLKKGPLARLYLKVKMYITSLLGVYNAQKKFMALMKQFCFDFYIFENSSDRLKTHL